MNVITPQLVLMYEQEGIPFGMTIKACQEAGNVVNWIMEYNLALWRGFSDAKFMTILKEELTFTHFTMNEQSMILKKLQEYIEQRDNYSDMNYYFVLESKKIAGVK